MLLEGRRFQGRGGHQRLDHSNDTVTRKGPTSNVRDAAEMLQARCGDRPRRAERGCGFRATWMGKAGQGRLSPAARPLPRIEARHPRGAPLHARCPRRAGTQLSRDLARTPGARPDAAAEAGKFRRAATRRRRSQAPPPPLAPRVRRRRSQLPRPPPPRQERAGAAASSPAPHPARRVRRRADSRVFCASFSLSPDVVVVRSYVAPGPPEAEGGTARPGAPRARRPAVRSP